MVKIEPEDNLKKLASHKKHKPSATVDVIQCMSMVYHIYLHTHIQLD